MKNMATNTSQFTNHCHEQDMSRWEEQSEQMYTYFYLMLFVPGLLLNTTALWVLCRHIRKKTKTVIFMINLAFADLAHILALPLRIYYYFTHRWPFGRTVCLLCFYLKYLNMYAAIMFLMCISVQRCFFLLKPFSARRWRRRYDSLISFVVWVVVGLGCSPFILMRSSSSSLNTHQLSPITNMTQFEHQSSFSTSSQQQTRPLNQTSGCFKDLPTRHVSPSLAVMIITLGELFGFLIPLLCICYSSVRIACSLTHRQRSEDGQNSARSRLHSFSSNVENGYEEKQSRAEKRRALRMVLSCSGLFLFCFGPYHINFPLYMLLSQNIITDCGTQLTIKQIHAISLCIANLSCCLNPVLYYFLTAEFRKHFTSRSLSFSGTLLSSPFSSPRNTKTKNNAPKRLDSTLSN